MEFVHSVGTYFHIGAELKAGVLLDHLHHITVLLTHATARGGHVQGKDSGG